jgi:hypothetical protein
MLSESPMSPKTPSELIVLFFTDSSTDEELMTEHDQMEITYITLSNDSKSMSAATTGSFYV